MLSWQIFILYVVYVVICYKDKEKTKIISVLWQQSTIAALIFDPFMSALPIIAKQSLPSDGLFTHQMHSIKAAIKLSALFGNA